MYYPLVKYTERFARPFPDFFPIAEGDPFDLWTKLVIYLPVVVYPLALVAIGVLALPMAPRRPRGEDRRACATGDHVGGRADAPAGVAARRRAAHPVRPAADVHPLRVSAVVRVARIEGDAGPAAGDRGDRHDHRARAGGDAAVEGLQADRLGISELHRRGAHRSRERDLHRPASKRSASTSSRNTSPSTPRRTIRSSSCRGRRDSTSSRIDPTRRAPTSCCSRIRKRIRACCRGSRRGRRST